MKKKVQTTKQGGEILCAAYCALLGVMLPLTVHDAYFDITRTKATVFWVLSGLFLAVFAVWRLAKRKVFSPSPRPALPDLLFALFALTHILASLLFRPAASALLAPDNRYQGILSFALYGGVFLVLRRHGAFGAPVRYALCLGFSLAALLAVSEVFGADLLGLRAISPQSEWPRFFSTIGNISFISALCVLFLALFSTLAVGAKDGRAALPWVFCALLALCCGIAMRTEGFVLGALSFFALLPLLTREARLLRRVPLLWAAAALAALGFSLAMRRWALYPLSTLGALLCSPALLLPLTVLCAVLWLWLRRRSDAAIGKSRLVYIIFFLLFFAAFLLFLVLSNTLWRERLPEALASAVVFSPSWGTDRGAEWISFFRMFREAPLVQKLIGGGAGSLAAWDRAHRLFSDAVTDSAHNEYLHYLLTGGVIGLAAYLALLVCAVRKAFRSPSPARTALGAAVAAYAVQAFVNIAQPFTTPLFFVLLALLLSDGGSDEKKPGENAPFWLVSLGALALVLLLLAAAA